MSEIKQYTKQEKEDLFKRYLNFDLKSQSYMNVLFSLSDKNNKKIIKVQKEVDPRENKKSSSFLANLLMHNNNDIKKYNKQYGKPVSTKELGEYGQELKCSYFYIFKILDKNVILFVDDRGTSIEVDSNITEEEFVETYRILLNTMLKANKEYLDFIK